MRIRVQRSRGFCDVLCHGGPPVQDECQPSLAAYANRALVWAGPQAIRTRRTGSGSTVGADVSDHTSIFEHDLAVRRGGELGSVRDHDNGAAFTGEPG